MAKSYDIADLMTSDGEYITDSVRRKINGNFRRVLQLMNTELPAAERKAIEGTVTTIATAITENIMNQRLPELEEELRQEIEEAMAEAQQASYPVGCVIVTTTEDDTRLKIGTWERVGQGRYIRSAADGEDALSEGGANSVTLMEANMPEHTHAVAVSTTVASAGAHTHTGTAKSAGSHSHNQHDETWYNNSNYDGWVSKSGGGYYAVSHVNRKTDAAGAHTHSLTVNSGGSHDHDATSSATATPYGSSTPEPIQVQPEYVNLLFYRRTA